MHLGDNPGRRPGSLQHRRGCFESDKGYQMKFVAVSVKIRYVQDLGGKTGSVS